MLVWGACNRRLPGMWGGSLWRVAGRLEFLQKLRYDSPEVRMSNLVLEAMSELRVALSQSIQSDDQVIVGHVRSALRFLEREKYEEAIRTPSSPERKKLIAEVMNGHK